MLPRLLHYLPSLLTATAAVLALALAAWLLERWVRHLAGNGTLAVQGEPAARQAHRIRRLIRHTAQAVGLLVVALVMLRGAGIGVPRLTLGQVSGWAMGPGLRIVFIFAGAFLLVRITDFLVSHLQAVLASADTTPLGMAERRKRIDTLGRLLRGLALLVIFGLAGLMALREVNVDITPLLTGAGVAGVAIGFGAQTMVKDLIAGVFLILENQIRVGDVVTINGKTGLVETIRLRILVLRGGDGAVYVFQNGAITEYANLTKDYSYAVLEISVGHKQDLGQVTAALEAAGEELRADAALGGKILAPLEVLGVDGLSAASVVLKMRMKTLPMEQWAVARELRRRVQAQLDAAGIALA